MANIVGGRFHGTGADVHICCGFVPDFVWLINVEDIGEQIIWNKYMTLAAAVEGYGMNDVTSVADLAATEGVIPYEGGDTLTSSQAGTTTYGEGVYLKHDPTDYRYGTNKAPGGGSGDAASDTIDTWTLDTPGSRSGHFNEDVTGTYIGPGSEICIDGLWYVITSLTATQGESDDEVVLNVQVSSGSIQCIKGMYGYIPMTAGETTPAGFMVGENTNCNANGEIVTFLAMKFDN